MSLWRLFLDERRARVQAKLSDESVAVVTLQMDKGCSFNLPIRNVVFNRVHEIGLVADERKLAGVQACSGEPTKRGLNNGSDCPPSTQYLA